MKLYKQLLKLKKGNQNFPLQLEGVEPGVLAKLKELDDSMVKTSLFSSRYSLTLRGDELEKVVSI